MTDAVGCGPTELSHPIQHVAREERFGLPRPIRILGRRESGIAEGWGRLVELDQLFIYMQILDHRTHLDVEPLSKPLARTVLRPLLLSCGPHSQQGQKTETSSDFRCRGGMLISRFWI